MVGHVVGAINGASIARKTSFLKDKLGQPVVVDNKPGAAGTLASQVQGPAAVQAMRGLAAGSARDVPVVAGESGLDELPGIRGEAGAVERVDGRRGDVARPVPLLCLEARVDRAHSASPWRRSARSRRTRTASA